MKHQPAEVGAGRGKLSQLAQPIGIFDSGLGGLSVLREVNTLLPAEDVLYYADSAHCPYGGRSIEFILERSVAITSYLVEHGAKLVVVACNTASSVALGRLREVFHVPIVGMVPAVKPAAIATRSGKIGVLATPRTVTGEALAALIREHAHNVRVYSVPAYGLVDLVEAGRTTGSEVEAALQPLIQPLTAKGVDTLVLGCTHYPFLRAAIAATAGEHVSIIESGEAVARRTAAVLRTNRLLSDRSRRGRLVLLSSSDAERTGVVASLLLGREITARTVPLETAGARPAYLAP